MGRESLGLESRLGLGRLGAGYRARPRGRDLSLWGGITPITAMVISTLRVTDWQRRDCSRRSSSRHDAAHPSATALKRYYKVDGNNVELQFGPKALDEKDIEETLIASCAACWS